MKRVFITLAFALVLQTFAFAGEDATNSWLTIQSVTTNGVSAMEIVAYYPSNWVSRILQTSSDISNSNNWSGIMLSEQVVPRVNAPTGEFPRWTKWIIKDDDTIGSRFFRIVKQSDVF
jgi:hypothetical protein